MKRQLVIATRIFLVMHTVFAFHPCAYSRTFVVNTTNDKSYLFPGEDSYSALVTNCTLRAAMEEANKWAGRDTIMIKVYGTLSPFMPLPGLNDIAGVYIIGPGATAFEIDARFLSHTT
ncbi:MAG: hypothetical protein V4615_04075, partial [Bacteroidota bacterium]